MAANGQIPQSQLARIPGNGWLRKDAAVAYIALDKAVSVNMSLWESAIRRTYRPLSAQWRAWNTMRRGMAAYPGTSNHGYGIAVDLMSFAQRQAVDRYGARFGWSKRWSDASHEWWHIRFRPGIYKPKARDPLWFLTADERRLVREYMRLKKLNRNKARRGVIFRWMIERRKNIYRAGEDDGWNKANRKRRYRFLYNLTKG